MKDLIKILALFTLVLLVYIFREKIIYTIYDKFIYKDEVLSYNEYFTSNNFEYLQIIDTDEVKNKQELLNMLYTIINSGDTSYAFYCKYDGCTDDVKKMLDDKEFLPTINNFVHPYNSFETINISIANFDRIMVSSKKVYSDSEIEYINNYIDDFISNNVYENMSTTDKIKVFHDYIINNYYYD